MPFLPGVAEADGDRLLERVRISFIQPATLERAGVEHGVLLIDLGLEGVYVEWPGDDLPVGEVVRVRFFLPGNDLPVRARCRVAWRHVAAEPSPSKALPSGVGLEFQDLDPADRARLQAHLHAHVGRDPRARQFTRWWPEKGGR